jgi:ADP-ribosyl-[dinitrogen reductase] hydrolase
VFVYRYPDHLRWSAKGFLVTSYNITQSENMNHQNAVRGCLFGGAVGDALGYDVEFISLETIRERFGQNGIREPSVKNGLSVVSDDTQMTMFTLDAVFSHLCNDRSDPIELTRDAYLRWNKTQNRDASWSPPDEPLTLEDEPSLNYLRAPGVTCCNALDAGGLGTFDNVINDSKGCGGVMRVAPVGLVRKWSPEECFDLGAQSAAITHSHSTGYLSTGAMAQIIREIVGGANPLEAAKRALDTSTEWSNHEETTNAIHAAITLAQTKAPPSAELVASLGEGWIAEEALAIGLYSCLAADTYVDAVCLAANHGGDSDSTASIAGQIFGTWKGVGCVQSNWIEQLDVYDPLSRLIDDFLAIV